MSLQSPSSHFQLLTADGHWFVDSRDRRVLLRGVNLGGSSKVPITPNGATHIPTDFSDSRAVSFVGRPFPLSDADEHYRRLRHWGFNCLRFLVTWEAVEHAGPGEYDEPYLEYLYAVVKRAGDHGFIVFIDPHQDVWSRMTGGDGAPGWTLELAGFDVAKLDVSEAAITMQGRYNPSAPWNPDRARRYRPMSWPNNWGRLATATMFTLFFGGNRFAPYLRVGGEPIQEYLQRHFIGAMEQVAQRLASLPHVIGYDSLNEPSRGYIGNSYLGAPLPVYNSAPQLSAFQSMVVGSGITIEVPFIKRQHLRQVPDGMVTLNPGRVSAWREPTLDLWRDQGIWDLNRRGQPVLLQDQYFAGVSFYEDYLRPFMRRYAAAIRRHHPGAFLFIESEPGGSEPLTWEHAASERIVNASHWYDLLTLITKRYDPTAGLVWGEPAIVEGEEQTRASFVTQIGKIVAHSQQELGGVPTLIGEFGVPFDLDGGASYRTNQFDQQAAALSTYYQALDQHLAHGTLWNYTPDNNNEWGDQWNEEDLSIFSRDQQDDPTELDSGGRGVKGFCRPFVRACAGTPLEMQFDVESGVFSLLIEAAEAKAPTEIYVPRIQYPEGYALQISSGTVDYDSKSQVMRWQHLGRGKQWFRLSRP